MKSMIDDITSPADIKALYNAEPSLMPLLAEQLRQRLVDTISHNGGHLSSNLGVVELTMALHIVFDSPADSIVFDVGHQSYVHKLLTGRAAQFDTIRKYEGISGFPKRSESVHDAFNTGHSSTSVSAALGIARAKKLLGDSSHTIAVLGDASLAGGMVFEAFDDLEETDLPLIIVLNDNEMAITGTVGAFGKHLSNIRTSRSYIKLKASTHKVLDSIPHVGKPLARAIERIKNKLKYFAISNQNIMFESLGLTYIGPIDGHNLPELCRAFNKAKQLRKPLIIHIVTVKGKGYLPAELHPDKFHGIGCFDKLHPDITSAKPSNSAIFGNTLAELAANDDSIVAISAAMTDSTGLTPFSEAFPSRFFDVGIAEQHAVTLAAGMCSRGLRPFVAIYSTFFQRAYDQLLHDVCLQNLPVVLCVDRAGLVGEDGETHQGIYDIAYMRTMPGMHIYSPSTVEELREMVVLATSCTAPTAVRYCRGCLEGRALTEPVVLGKWEIIAPPSPVTVISTGRLVASCIKAASDLPVGIINARFINPLDTALLDSLSLTCNDIVVVEDSCANGSLGSAVASYLSASKGISVHIMAVLGTPVRHASVAKQDELCGISVSSIRTKLCNILGRAV